MVNTVFSLKFMDATRKILLALLILTSLSPAMAQKKDWSFSDKTGIKGVQMSFGINYPQNMKYWAEGVFQEYGDSNWKQRGDNYYSTATRPQQFPVMLELVHAPFRFHTNPYLKRLELTGGIYYNHLKERHFFTTYKDIDETHWETRYISYSMSNRQFGIHAGFNLSQPITHSLMVYGGYGLGLNLFGKFIVSREFYQVKQHYTPSDTMPTHSTLITDLPRQTLAYYPQMFTQQFIVGAKAYLTCRMNIYAEYNYRTFHVLRPGMADLSNNGHGLVLGIRYKFNPPEPDDPNAPPEEPDAFW